MIVFALTCALSRCARPQRGRRSGRAQRDRALVSAMIVSEIKTRWVLPCSNQSPLALRATARAEAAAEQPRHEVRVSTWLDEGVTQAKWPL
jgi:hypothetical protein